MSSQEEIIQPLASAPDISTPSTPVPQHATLPDEASVLTATGILPTIQASRLDQAKYSSPPMPSSSATPPPSSQVRQIQRPPPGSAARVFRTPSPQMSLLSSPPLTSKLPLPRKASRISAEPPSLEQITAPNGLPTPEEIANAPENELRSLASTLQTSAAHYKLQHGLLSMESFENAQRAEVEHNLTRREVEFLQIAQQNHHAQANPPSLHCREAQSSQNGHLANELKLHCQDLQSDNDLLRRRLRRAKKEISKREGEILSLAEQNERLKRRIMENREHVNDLLRSRGIYEATTPHIEVSTPHRSTPRHHDSARSAHAPGGPSGDRGAFAALLMADQVLSQENASAPSTPTRTRPSKQHSRHTRGSHSLSSLPTISRISRPIIDKYGQPSLTTSMLASGDNHETNNRSMHSSTFDHQSVRGPQQEEAGRRESRDSTISASDMEDENQLTSDDDEVPLSQASQLATRMLKVSPKQKIEVRGTPKPGNSSGLLQSKLFGNIQKAGLERGGKRKTMDTVSETQRNWKKPKAHESVGLGIGGWSSPRS